jgi:hypothetical protein
VEAFAVLVIVIVFFVLVVVRVRDYRVILLSIETIRMSNPLARVVLSPENPSRRIMSMIAPHSIAEPRAIEW